jgi:hypothetical protein
VYLSNAEKEALFLTGYGDVPPCAVQQGLVQALARGTYVPGEEALRLRLAEQLDLEERLAAQAEDDAFAEGLQQDLVEGVEASQEAAAIEGAGAFTAEQIADYLAFPGGYEGHPDDHERMQLLRQLHNAKPTTEGQEAAEEPPTAPWRSPLEIVTEGAEEAEQEAPGEEDAHIPFSSFTKAQLLEFLSGEVEVEFDESDSKEQLRSRAQELVDKEGGPAAFLRKRVAITDEAGVPIPWSEVDKAGGPAAFRRERVDAGAPGEEDAAPAAVAQRIEDRDFSSFTKAQLLTFAADHFGVQLKLADSKDELIAQVQRLVDEANEKAV